jgi:hypothetical protein
LPLEEFQDEKPAAEDEIEASYSESSAQDASAST